MALTPTQEAQVLQLVAEQAALLSLAGNEATIISKLGATKVNLSSLGSAATFGDADIMLIRQGTTDLSIVGSVVKAAVAVPDASETVKGKVELATSAETIAGTSTTLAVHPAGVAAAISGVGAAVSAAFSNLKASATGLSAVVTITADELIVRNGTSYKTLTSVSVTPSLAASGVNGLDTGTSAISTWYAVFVIWNGTTTAGLLSLSATTPTMPSGYTHKARVGWVRSDGTANKFPFSFIQRGNNVNYNPTLASNTLTIPAIASGTAGVFAATPTYVAVSVSTVVPATASSTVITIHGSGAASGSAAASSENVSPTQSVQLLISQNASFPMTGTAEILLQGTNIYWVSNLVSFTLSCRGWVDNI